MKIIHIISGNLGQGGAERLVMDLASAQAYLGNDVTICSFRDYRRDTLDIGDNVKLHSFGKSKGISPLLPFRIAAYLKKEKPDIVNLHLPAVFLYILWSLYTCKNARFFYTIHSYPDKEEPRKWVRKIRRHFVEKGLLEFIGISKSTSREFDRLYDVKDTVTVCNGRKDIQTTEHLDRVREEIASYKKNDDTLVFIAVGRLYDVKNFPLMIKAFADITDRNVILLILGSGDVHQYDNIKAANTFVLGPKYNVADYLSCADAFCMSSIWEGFPISIIEAMSAALPVLTTNVGGIPDVVTNGYNGLLSRSLDVKDYRLMIENFLSMGSENRRKISENCRKDFLEKYHIPVIAEEYLRLYAK